MGVFTGLAIAGIASAAVGAVSSIKAADAQKDAAKAAAAASERATKSTLELQKYIYDTTREDYEPWMEVGKRALQGLVDRVDKGEFDPANFKFMAEPGYAHRLAEGNKQLERAASARGSVLSGEQLKALTRFGQEFAANEYQAAYNRNALEKTTRFDQLASLAQVGQTGQRVVAGAGQNYANMGSQAYMWNGQNIMNAAYTVGNANASMYTNLGQIGQKAISNIAQIGMLA